MDVLNAKAKKFWLAYCKEADIDPHGNHFVTANPAGNFDITDNLIELYRKGKKRAGSSLVEDFKAEGDPLPKVNDYWILLNSKKEPTFLLKTVKIETNKFANIPQHVVDAEGEGDLSIIFWKQEHTRLYTPYLERWGIKDLNQANVITEYFEIVYPK